MPGEDRTSYYKYTGPARLDKAVHTLEGMLLGISADQVLSAEEVQALKEWMSEHREFQERHPFNEIFPVLARALTDDRLDQEEALDLLWLCAKMKSDNQFYCAVTSDMQRLHGIAVGIIADEIVTMEELDVLNAWMEEHEHLRTLWPYDELEGLLLAVKQDGKIDAKEHARLLTFLSEFANMRGHRSLDLAQPDGCATIMGVCAVCPQIIFPGKNFCFTGESPKATKSELKRTVECRGATCLTNVTLSLDYLVIGAMGNPCWTYAAYGRKVEKAVEYRKTKGSHMLIVHESDFRDAVQGAE